VPPAFKARLEPESEDLLGEPQTDDAAAHREDVGVVVQAGQTCGEEIVAERRANARDLVRRDLLSLTASTDDDPSIDLSVGDQPADGRADRRIVNGRVGVRPQILDPMAEAAERLLQAFFEREAGMIRPDRDAHHVNSTSEFWILDSVFLQTVEPTVVISHRGEERIRAGHPWVYRTDVVAVRADGGDTVRLLGARGRRIGHALYSDRSEIAIRVLTRDDEPAGLDLWRARIEAAAAYRAALHIDATAYRLVHGEADLLPSLVVDRYGDYLVVQALSQGTDRLLPELVAILVDRLRPAGVLARNDPRVRQLEGLEQKVELLHGTVPDRLTIREGAIEYEIDPWRGQKTGLFLDQRENRAAAAAHARGRALDCFSYHGGFALTLARRCESVLALDISAEAVARIEANALRNELTNVRAKAVNVFDELHEMDRADERFDTIVLDPPAFAKSRSAVTRARAGYKEINLRALKLLRRGGYLVTCSCSYNLDEGAFGEIVWEASVDARASVVVVEKRMQARDHPVLIGVPETYYLKCFILRKLL
jgi:23S rRNA (cytosine1962-C5)-methyltransferase